MPPRKSLKKWVERDYEKRLTERGLNKPSKLHISVFKIDAVFQAAEELVKYGRQNRGQFIFLGQSMRPLFESVRSLNEIERAVPRRNLKYIVTPKSSRVNFQRDVETVKQNLLQRKVASEKQNTYFIVDVSFVCYTKKVVTEAIKRINPNAVVIDMQKGVIGEGIIAADANLTVPTNKHWRTAKVSPGQQHQRDHYLVFQQALQDYLKERRR